MAANPNCKLCGGKGYREYDGGVVRLPCNCVSEKPVEVVKPEVKRKKKSGRKK